MDPYKDPDEFIKNLGAEAFERADPGGRNSFLFGIEMLERDYDMGSPEGKTAFLKEAARRLLTFDEEIERNNYIDAVARTLRRQQPGSEETGDPHGGGRADLPDLPAARGPRQTGRGRREDGHLKSQKILLTWMLEEKRTSSGRSDSISPLLTSQRICCARWRSSFSPSMTAAM